MNLWRLLFALAFLVAALSSGASERDEITLLYRAGVSGNKEAVERCITMLERAFRNDPADQLARVYLGSAYTLRSRDLGFGPAKLQALKQGLAIMDAAVTAVPDDAHVRLVRAMTTDALPFFVGRSRATAEDFKILADVAREKPAVFIEGEIEVIRQHTR